MKRLDHAPTHAVPCRFPWVIGDTWMVAVGNGSLDNPCGVMEYYNGTFRIPRSTKTVLDEELGVHGTHLDVMVRDCAPDLAVLAMQGETSDSWVCAVVPHLLPNESIDAMTKLRLAARWAEAKA